MNTDQQLEQRVRDTLQAVASQFEPVPPGMTPRRNHATIGSVAAVVAAGTIAGGVLYLRNAPESTTSGGLASQSSIVSGSDSVAVPRARRVVGLSTDTDGFSGPVTVNVPYPPSSPNWQAVLTTPDGGVVSIVIKPGSVPSSDIPGGSDTVNGMHIVAWTVGQGARRYAFDLGCSVGFVTMMPEIEPWSAAVTSVLTGITVDESTGRDRVTVSIPEGWTSLGSGYLGASVRRSLRVDIDGKRTSLTLVQHIDTEPGAIARRDDLIPITVRNKPAFAYGDGDSSAIVFPIGNDAIGLSGPVGVDDLVDIAASLESNGPAIYDVLPAAVSRPDLATDYCSISLVDDEPHAATRQPAVSARP